MVKSVNQTQNSLGMFYKIGNTPEGRTIYEIKNEQGQSKKLTLPSSDCDKFEKSFKNIAENGPKLEEYMRNTPPEKLQKKQKLAKWIIGIGALIGAGIPALKLKTHWYIQLPAVIGGLGLGLITGGIIAKKTTTPPGISELAQATQTMTKIDIQPYLA